MTPAPLLAAVDRAAFVAALGGRLREAGVPVGLTALAALAEGLAAVPPRDRASLYWLARVALVRRPEDLPVFDRVLGAVLGEGAPGPGGPSGPGTHRPRGAGEGAEPGAGPSAVPGPAGSGLPWFTLATDDDEGEQEGDAWLPDLRPSAVEPLADVPFEELDEAQLATVAAWLERVAGRWPVRAGRRRRVHPAGRRVALRETITRSRRTGWEPLRLSRTRPVPRPRPVVMVLDVSQSMQPYAQAYLHLMRALARAGRAETFCCATGLTRLTPALAHRSAETALALAADQAGDRYGGTRLASSLRALLASRQGGLLRGGVLVVASDGWDSEEPEALAHELRRIRLRAHRVVWLNPRKAAPGYRPLVASMAAALPFCDAFLPAHTLRAALEALDEVVLSRVP